MSLIGPNEFEEDRQHAASDGMPNLRSKLAENRTPSLPTKYY
jgi:hypothetical protein